MSLIVPANCLDCHQCSSKDGGCRDPYDSTDMDNSDGCDALDTHCFKHKIVLRLYDSGAILGKTRGIEYSNLFLCPPSPSVFSSPKPKAHKVSLYYTNGPSLSSVFHTFILEYLWSQLANLDQILCLTSLGWGKGCIQFWGRFDQNSSFHGNRKPPLTYNGKMKSPTFLSCFWSNPFYTCRLQ